jgi:hypothetical protein
MIIAFCLVASQREILGWYVVWLVPFYALLPSVEWSLIVGSGLSLGLLLTYAPFLYTGSYDPPVQTIKLWSIIIPVVLSFVWIAIRKLICPAHKPQV